MEGEPTRGGTRGGAGDFSWNAVKEDKHREYYLGHSVKAAAGRWQKNKDIHWYNRDDDNADEGEIQRKKKEEIKKIKEAEEDALSVALGYAPKPRQSEEEKIAAKAQKNAEKRIRKEERDKVRAEREQRRKESGRDSRYTPYTTDNQRRK
ncbi:hypothetical protein E3P89_01477 [Wallemia ichthyophaga]|uniref:Multiple myeloma tumor-associated protein 2-like N-terminal domain-containing protein n=2 Tax=Wallemia ichthyophaga TaxID=245174 RepID=A0A4T0IE15_WALIC|nr:Multiple myeloma tumor-associated protein 2-like protein [Wallemia ichthyophaga EXF-994]TIA99918.1 hypothetical protein E3P96_02796 [Wallemia ichthyophaga]EOQ99802.1 Multiple myeloma tumor-associated protein 2-like protein [Wallemia ichthyophaga EXF-994]TIB12800.1 hypothetical protein E3P90_01937 [Wallemia ichthyophaga]TIB14462.1 hypothetical protein E3P93_01687 [Wallemia ichthyophaga]TIB23489.1 hypothetical protein E3P89_01477 [Wallemia ichthyophaga]